MFEKLKEEIAFRKWARKKGKVDYMDPKFRQFVALYQYLSREVVMTELQLTDWEFKRYEKEFKFLNYIVTF